jgi:hypothetical protein
VDAHLLLQAPKLLALLDTRQSPILAQDQMGQQLLFQVVVLVLQPLLKLAPAMHGMSEAGQVGDPALHQERKAEPEA